MCPMAPLSISFLSDPSILLWLGQAGDAVTFLADGNGELTKALDLELDLKKAGLGVRSKRYAGELFVYEGS